MNSVLVEKILSTGQALQLVQGDITIDEVDAIVNAANEHLAHGGGVAWAISKKGGPVVQQESDDWVDKHGPVSHVRPAWTSGGRLPAKYIIHAVGPVWGSGNEDQKLTDAVSGSLRLAAELKCESISLPAISTGIFGFPKERAAEIIFNSIRNFFSQDTPSEIKLVRILLHDQPTIDAFMKKWDL